MKKVLDFYAPWCAPCKAAESSILETAQRLGLTVEKINVEVARPLFEKFGVKTVPTLVFLEGETEKGRISGSEVNKNNLFDFMSRHV